MGLAYAETGIGATYCVLMDGLKPLVDVWGFEWLSKAEPIIQYTTPAKAIVRMRFRPMRVANTTFGMLFFPMIDF